jgi:hypothetical protein
MNVLVLNLFDDVTDTVLPNSSFELIRVFVVAIYAAIIPVQDVGSLTTVYEDG